MSSISDLTPGCIGFGPIKGAAGALVNAGQLLLGEGFHVGDLDIRHVFVVTNVSTATPVYPEPGNPYLSILAVEAMPAGARHIPIEDRWTPEYAYARLPEDYPGQAEDAAVVAQAMIGTPYSFLSYAALAAWRFGLATPRLEKWIGRRRPAVELATNQPVLKARGEPVEVALPAEAICSVLADQAWTLAGKKVMQGVPHQCVTPGALAKRLLWMPDVRWMVPE